MGKSLDLKSILAILQTSDIHLSPLDSILFCVRMVLFVTSMMWRCNASIRNRARKLIYTHIILLVELIFQQSPEVEALDITELQEKKLKINIS